jgi:protein SCO1/2
MSISHKLLAAVVAAAPTALFAGGAALPQLPGVEWRAPPAAIEDFTLTDQHGRAVRFSSLRGKTVLVFFGFTNCPDICPTTMHELHLTSMSTRVDVTKLQVLMISVDGRRDTPAALRAFLATQSQRFMAMTGEPARLTAIAARFPAVFVLPPEAGTARSYNVAHTGAVYLIDAQGRLRATMSKASVNDMARATQIVQQGAPRRG